MPKTWNSKQYSGKKHKYRPTTYPGVARIFEWDEKRSEYLPRQTGPKYYAYRKVAGKQISEYLDTYEEAKAWRDSGYLSLQEEKLKELTFKEVRKLFFEHMKSRVKESTLETYENNSRHLQFFDMMAVSKITVREVNAWLMAVKKPEYLAIQHKTRLSYEHDLQVLRQILQHYGEYHDPSGSYVLPIKKRHSQDCIIDLAKHKQRKAVNATKYIPREECEKFLQVLKQKSEAGETVDLLCYLLAYFQLRTGVRVGEAASVQWEDLNLKTGEVLISRTVQWTRKAGEQTYIGSSTKSNKSRDVNCNDDHLIAVLKAWMLKCGRSQGLIFSVNGAEPLTRRQIQHRYNQALKAIGSKYTGTHIMRHSFGTDYLEVTENPMALKEIMGHSNLQQTEKYAKTTKALKDRGNNLYRASFKKEDVQEKVPLGTAG